jgi:alpha-mannosidase
VRLYHGLRRIEVATQVRNEDKWVRYQALFPTTLRGGRSVHEIPFGALERPAGIEYPAQHWVDLSDGQRGLALLNDGLPGNVMTDGTLMLSLVRSHTLGAYGYGGGYEPGMSSESGLQVGRSFTLRYALLTHAGDWRAAQVWREGWAYNRPLLCRKVAAHAGPLPRRWSLVQVAHPQVVLTACKPGPDGTTVLRVYEASGQPATGVTVRVQPAIATAREADLLERPTGPATADAHTLRFDLRPFEIKTFTLTLQQATP